MNVGSGNSGDDEVMIDINTTPLIDVMLVLIIMPIITIPVQLHSVNLNMPAGNLPPPVTPPVVGPSTSTSMAPCSGNGETIPDQAALGAPARRRRASPTSPRCICAQQAGVPRTWRR